MSLPPWRTNKAILIPSQYIETSRKVHINIISASPAFRIALLRTSCYRDRSISEAAITAKVFLQYMTQVENQPLSYESFHMLVDNFICTILECNPFMKCCTYVLTTLVNPRLPKCHSFSSHLTLSSLLVYCHKLVITP